ncbi:MAG: thiol reductant ABC exporter subunit CydC [Ectothiorhodospiraceae bacterium]|nr:thiol reductant ABC exporter subunit CydC [Ectothiorhodospiraceae bacterium]
MKELRPYLRLLGRRRLWLLAGGGLMLLTAAANFGLLALSGWFITATALAGLALAAGAGMQLDIYTPGAGIRLFAVGRAVSRYAERLINHEAVFRILADLRVWLFRHLLPLDTATLAGLRNGDLLNRLTADIDALDHLYLRVLGPVAVAGLGLLGGLAFLAWLSPAVALTIGLVLVPVTLMAGWLTARHARKAAGELGELGGRLREHLVGDLQAQAELHVFGAVRRHLQKIKALDHRRLRAQQRLAVIQALAQGLVLAGMLATLWLALQVGIGQVQQELVSGPVLVAILLAIFALGELVMPLPQAFLLMGKVRWSASRLTELADTPPAVTAPPQPAAAPPDNRLAFRNVSFRYRSNQPACLEELDLCLEPGERVAVLGPSGSGKSTLLRLALREADPAQGSVLLGGTDLRRLDPAVPHDRMSWLSQRTTLFAGSIAMNLRLGAPAADETALWRVLEAVRLADVVDQLPRKLESWLGEGGTGLSGGQARRLALARVLLKPAPILLLDEPTEGLDHATEQAVLQDMEPWLRGRSLLIIAHDRHRLPRVDRRLVLRGGRLHTEDPTPWRRDP